MVLSLRSSFKDQVSINTVLWIVMMIIILFIVVFMIVNPPSSDGTTKYSSFTGYAHLSAGLCCGLRLVMTTN